MDPFKIKIVEYQNNIESITEIRNSVFIEEQHVPENIEIDGLDSQAKHALVFSRDQAVGTGRMFSDGHIGRIAVIKAYRGIGIGKLIMETLIETAQELHLSEVWLSSQYHAKEFYQKLGFIEVGDMYQEAQIDHIKMKKVLTNTSR